VIRNYNKDFLSRAHDAIDNESYNERQLSTLTISVNESELESIKKKINELRKQINLSFSPPQGSSKKTDKKHVVALNTQLLILTQTLT